MMNNSDYTVAGNLVFSVNTKQERIRDGFLSDTILTFQLSGQLKLETATEKIVTKAGDILLNRKNQFVKVAKSPIDGEDYRTVIMIFKEENLRKFALKRNIEISEKYKGTLNHFVKPNEFFTGFLNSILPYGNNPQATISVTMGELKMEEAIELLLQYVPNIKSFLFDFSEPYKIDLEKFMLQNYQFNLSIEKFAKLTGRSLASFKRDFQKTFANSPRKWLQDKRLTEAYHQIKNSHRKPTDIYLELGFESLPHFSNAFKGKYGVSPTHI